MINEAHRALRNNFICVVVLVGLGVGDLQWGNLHGFLSSASGNFPKFSIFGKNPPGTHVITPPGRKCFRKKSGFFRGGVARAIGLGR